MYARGGWGSARKGREKRKGALGSLATKVFFSKVLQCVLQRVLQCVLPQGGALGSLDTKVSCSKVLQGVLQRVLQRVL